MSAPAILEDRPLGFPWHTEDPFLFCVHHDDAYPAGNEHYGPATSLLSGRDIGQDFSRKDGWSMYHGDVVPGFPQHPHRGFETVTIVRNGVIDHSDSLGATARFGHGDVQWLTAGKGIVHSEMFPLLARDKANPLELFQIWLNLPRAKKFAEPHFSMLWNDAIPTHSVRDDAGRIATVRVIAGAWAQGDAPSPPPPDSWASHPDAQLAIWTLTLDAQAKLALPAAAAGINRWVYFFRGASVKIDGRTFNASRAIKLRSDAEVTIEAGADKTELLLLQARPIAEPVAQHGPFVMNTRDEVVQAYNDYRATRFGGWPWQKDGPVHAADAGRFARHADGRVEKK